MTKTEQEKSKQSPTHDKKKMKTLEQAKLNVKKRLEKFQLKTTKKIDTPASEKRACQKHGKKFCQKKYNM